MISGFSLGGFIVFAITFYIAWKCWLKDRLEELILEQCCGDYGESILSFFEYIGFFQKWRENKERREDLVEFYGLSQKEIAICKEAIRLNKIKYEEAIKIRWDNIKKNAIRPNDLYHRVLLDNNKKIDIESTRPIENIELVNIKKEKPGTPRRRRRSQFI